MAYDVDTPPAAYATARARRYRLQLLLLLVAAVLLLLLTLVAGFGLRSNLLAWGALLALYGVSRLFKQREGPANRWSIGAGAESAVGTTLNELRTHGFTVMHDIAQEGEGNVDHLVSGPTGVYLIETKSGRYLPAHLTKAKRQAAKLHDTLGVWVTPVISRPGAKVFCHKGVWIVPPEHLIEWLRSQRNRPCDFARLAAFVDAL